MTTLEGDKFFNDLPGLVRGGLRPLRGSAGGWIDFSYELDCFAGRGLAAGAGSGAGELVLDLNLTGWHRLHFAHGPALRVWLDGDEGYCLVPGNKSCIGEYAFPAADLTGRALHIAPHQDSRGNEEITLFYVRAEPCEPRTSRRNLICTNDGYSVFCRPDLLTNSREGIVSHIHTVADSDFFRVMWGVYGGGPLTVRANSPAGESVLNGQEHAFRHYDREFYRSMRTLVDQQVDPLVVVRKATRDFGLELDYYFRTACFFGPFPLRGRTTNFFRQHPEWRSRDEFGNSLNAMSYAWPQVQDHVLAYFEELLDYEPEGLCLAFNRGLPMMVCEEPVVEAFRRAHGRAPKLPEEVDTPEMLAVRHKLLHGFVQRVKKLCEERGARLSCIAPRDFEKNRLFGLDLDGMLRDGLFDSALIGAGHGDDPELNPQLEPVRKLRKHGVPIYPGGSDVQAHGCAWAKNDWGERARFMRSILDAGLDGAFFWDAHNVAGTDWATIRQFGDREFLDRLASGQTPSPVRRKTLEIDGTRIGRYSTWVGY